MLSVAQASPVDLEVTMSESYEERKRTNTPALYFCIVFVLTFFAFFGYTFFNASLYRSSNGFDDCGNICGLENARLSLPYCGSNDKRKDKFILVKITNDAINPDIKHVHSKCVHRCEDFPGFKPVMNRCYLMSSDRNGQDEADELKSTFETVAEDLANSWHSILITCVVALVFSYLVLILFRYAIKYVIWIIYISFIVALLVGSIVALGLYFSGKEGDRMLLFVSGALFLGAVVLGLVLYSFRKRIRLVIELFKEASRALSDVPMLLFEPALTLLALALTFVAFLYVKIVVASSGVLTVENDENGTFKKATYETNAAIEFTSILNNVAVIWFTSFILGCQHFVVASTISQWFFTRSRDKLDSPIARAFSLLLCFHLGSICLGSIFITIMKILKMISRQIVGDSAQNSANCLLKCVACCFLCFIENLEELLKYLVRNAYIIVAKDGTPLITSGKKAFHYLAKHLLDVITLNKVGDFVLLLARVFVALIAGFVGYELVSRNQAINTPFIPIALCVILAFLIIHCFMTVFEMTLDTIFICFCEDCEENDGNSKPYFMSIGMMKIMRELKQAAGGDFDFGNGQNVEAGDPLMIQQPNKHYQQ